MTRSHLIAIFSAVVFAGSAGAHPPTEYVEGDAIVIFKASADLPSARKALAKHSLNFDQHFAGLSKIHGRHFGLVRAKTRTTMQLIAELKADPDVEIAEPNYLRWPDSVPNNALFPVQWSAQNTGQTISNSSGIVNAGTPGADIEFLPAWSMTRSDAKQVVVGVLDTGVTYTHPDLVGTIWMNPMETPGNGLDDDGNGFVDDYYGYNFGVGNANPSDSGFHGTHVAGTIAATGNNFTGVAGINYRAKIMALRVATSSGSFPVSAIISALQYATMMRGRGVNLVALNESFGGGGYSSSEVAAIQAAGNVGVVVCAAAGNNGTNNDTTPLYPAAYHLPNMIVVAATNQNDALASFSNYGPTTVDLGAPGVNILSTSPAGASGANTFFQVGSASYSPIPMTYSGTAASITGTVYYCGLGYPEDFPPSVAGNIALIQRGTLPFSTKVTNAMAVGARAAIIYNNVSGAYVGTLQTAGNWIPTQSISQADGQALLATLPAPGTFNSDYQFLDGTSMAAPHVTAAVAFAAMNFPDETVAQRIQRILTNAEVTPGLQGKVATGGRLNLLRIVDTDGNGLPDWWEKSYFNQPGGVDPNADPDHDGLTNAQEYLAGTNPADSRSALRISSIVKSNAAAGFVITWASVPGKSYQVFRSDSPGGPWLSDLPGSLLTAAGGQTNLSYTDTSAASARRFYRVGLVVP